MGGAERAHQGSDGASPQRDREMHGGVDSPTRSREVAQSHSTVAVPAMRWDSRWVRISRAKRNARALETPPLYKMGVNPTDISDFHPRTHGSVLYSRRVRAASRLNRS